MTNADEAGATPRRRVDNETSQKALEAAKSAQEMLMSASSEADRWRGVRDDAIRTLLDQGWSLRAAADALGVKWSTVRYVGRQRR